MSEQSKAYEAQKVDAKWYQKWIDEGYFKASATSSKPSYCIVMPPPNVTGVLHMGHALVNTLQDVLIRWKRMSGFESLWIPGTDHAGIATQTVVERHLIKTRGKKRKDFEREEFLSEVWNCKEQSEGTIVNQLKKLGCSCDWDRQRFTMDEGNNRSVRTMFKKLYDQGLIYRGDYLVNWDPVTQTALADDEVEYEERQSFLWHIIYPLEDGSEKVVIATTRPETMLGDTAVAVSPKDPRYAHLIGKYILQPITGRKLLIIADRHVDPEFGTGVVKITPAHDPNDYAMGIEHKLPFLNMMTPDGRVNEVGGEFAGLSMEEARKAVVEALKNAGMLAKVEPHVNRVGVSYRSKAVIEPYMSKQWFVKMDSFKEQLKKAIVEGKLKLVPQNWENTYHHWIDNLRDWCISRQLWWGHRIPIWYSVDNPENMICYDGDDLPTEVKNNPEKWKQDDDVLDTWFSSALWPFSTLGWPENTKDFEKFYPNSCLITGHDILFFWVARMLMMGEYATGELPFPETFLHGLIYGKSYWRVQPQGGIAYVSEEERLNFDLGKPVPKDVQFRWEKMSKSKGNVIDPIEMIEAYGTDAVRMALCGSCTQAREIDLDRRRFEEWRNFANKVWNGARFVFMNLTLTPEQFAEGLDLNRLHLEDKWILSALNRTVKEVNEKLERYTFDQAALQAYDFFWKEFCAYYVEFSKPVLFGKAGTEKDQLNKQRILGIVLNQMLRLIHPMAPFITEELFTTLKEKLGGAEAQGNIDPYTKEALAALKAPHCIVAPYPKMISEKDIDQKIESAFSELESLIHGARNIRGEMKIPPGSATDLHIVGPQDNSLYQLLKDHPHLLTAMVKTNTLTLHTNEPSLGFASHAAVGPFTILVPMPQEMLEQEKARLVKEREKLVISIQKGEGQLENQDFVSRAPAALIEKHKLQLENAKQELLSVSKKLEELK